jgi:hypothetical protein
MLLHFQLQQASGAMKTYPSIIRDSEDNPRFLKGAYIFDKLDGNNLRFEFSKKRGWYKAGSRTQLIDINDERFGPAIEYFHNNLGDAIVSKYKRTPDRLVVFCEWVGPRSFCGMHHPDDELRLVLFDVCVDKRGFMIPSEFVKVFGAEDYCVEFLGIHNFGKELIKDVREGTFEGVTIEGIVAKTTRAKSVRVMAKAKTQVWMDRVHALHDPKKAAEILAS